MQPLIPIVDFHAHLKGESSIIRVHALEHRLLDRLVSGSLEVAEPIFYSILDFLATRFRSRWPRWIYRGLSILGWKQVAHIFDWHDVTELLAAMDRNGISHTVICAIEPFFLSEPIARAISPHQERFSFFCSIDPFHPEPAARLTSIMASYPVHGLKIHPTLTALDPSGVQMFRLMELAAKHQLPVAIHTGTFPFDTAGWDDVELLEPVLASFPEVTVILTHTGWDQYRKVLALASRYPQVYVETSWQPARVIRLAVKQLGSDRVLFGSDYPLLKQEYALAHVRQALSTSDFRKVVSENAMRLLGLRLANC